MSHEASEGWVERRVRAAMQSETDALRAGFAALAEAVDASRAETAELRTMIHSIGVEMGKSAAKAEADLGALRAAMAGDERIEALRLRIDGLLAQHRWDTDQLNQSLSAIAERLPLGD